MSTISHDDQIQELTCCRKTVFAVASLLILVFMIYSNTFNSSWHFDDMPNITQNPRLHMTEISWTSIKSALFSDRNNPNMPYRPVACLSFALNYYFGGLNVFGYHLVNTLIHTLTAIFLFLFLYRTLTLPTLREKYGKSAYFVALLAAWFWAINPIQTQAITYLVQRMASMAALFYIMAMYFYLLARSEEKRRSRFFYFVICFTAFLLAIGSKENAAMLPVSIFLFEVLIIQEDPARFLRAHLLGLIGAFTATLVLGLAYLYFKSGSLFSFLGGYEGRPFSLTQRLMTEPRIILYYISIIFYPIPSRLNVAHDFPLSVSLFHPVSTIAAILFLVAGAAVAVFLGKKQRILSFSVLFFLLNHLIESSVFPLELVFEHRNYLPSMFLFTPIALGLYGLISRYEIKPFMKSAVCIFLVLVLVVLGHSTFMRNFTWKNDKSLWIDAVDKSPALFRPRHNLAKYYQDRGQFDEAISEYEIALKTQTSFNNNEKFVAYYNLGKMYFDKQDYEKAISYYKNCMLANPVFTDAYNNLAVTYTAMGKYNLAFQYLQKALQIGPYQADAHYNLALLYLKWRDPDKAILHLNRAVKNATFEIISLDKMGIAYKQKREFGRAAKYFLEALTKNPGDIWIHLHLAELYFKTNLEKRSLEEIDQVLHLIPDQKAFHVILDRLSGASKSILALPDPPITIELLVQGCERKSKNFNKWEKELLRIPKPLNTSGGVK